LDNSNYDNFHGGGSFSHVYVITHQYFVKKTRDAKNEYISFYIQLNMFACMKFSYTFCWHIRPQILNLVNRKNQSNGGKKIHFACSCFKMDFVSFKKFISYIIESNALYEHCQT
jgi:hypothetical protein